MAKGSRSQTRILHGLRDLSPDPKELLQDLVAGLSLWAVTAPQAVAYAKIANVPPGVGLTAIPVAMAIYGFLGPSKRLVAAANSAVAITSGLLVSQLAGGDVAQVVALSSTLALLVGAVLFLLGLGKLGFFADFIAMPVITGFLLGVAVLIILGQAPKILGIPSEHGHGPQQLVELGRGLADAHGWTVGVGIASLLLLWIFERGPLRIPGAMLWVVAAGIIASILLDLEEKGVQAVGSVTSGVIALKLPNLTLSNLLDLLLGALGLAMVAISETLAVARRLAAPKRRAVHSNKELIALGTANLGAGLMGGFAVCGSLSATEVNQQAGARTSLSSLFAACFVLATGLFFTGVLRHLPEAVLGAIVIQAAVGSIRTHSFAKLFRIRRSDFVLAAVAFVGVVGLGILRGILLSVLLSVGWLVFRASRAPYSILGRSAGEMGFEDLATNPDAKSIPGILIYRFDAPIFFANARRVHETVMRLVEEQKPRMVILDMEMTFELDTTAAEEMVHLLEDLQEADITLTLARVRAQPREIMGRIPRLAELVDRRLFLTVRSAVDAHAAAAAADAPARKK